MRKQTFWFPTMSDTNQAVQLQKMARGLKFQIYKEEGLYYLCSENKGAEHVLSGFHYVPTTSYTFLLRPFSYDVVRA